MPVDALRPAAPSESSVAPGLEQALGSQNVGLEDGDEAHLRLLRYVIAQKDKKAAQALTLDQLRQLRALPPDSDDFTREVRRIFGRGERALGIVSRTTVPPVIKDYHVIGNPESPAFDVRGWVHDAWGVATDAFQHRYLPSEERPRTLPGQAGVDHIETFLRPLAPDANFRGLFVDGQNIPKAQVTAALESLQIETVGQVMLPNGVYVMDHAGRFYVTTAETWGDVRTPAGRFIPAYRIGKSFPYGSLEQADIGHILIFEHGLEKIVGDIRTIYETYGRLFGDLTTPPTEVRQRLGYVNYLITRSVFGETFDEGTVEDRMIRLFLPEEGAHSDAEAWTSALRRRPRLPVTTDQDVIWTAQQLVRPNSWASQWLNEPAAGSDEQVGRGRAIFEIEAKLEALTSAPEAIYMIFQEFHGKVFQQGEPFYQAARREMLARLSQMIVGRVMTDGEWLEYFLTQVSNPANAYLFRTTIQDAARRVHDLQFLTHNERTTRLALSEWDQWTYNLGSSGLEEGREAGLEQTPPVGRWIKPGEEARQEVWAVVRKHKTQSYTAPKKGPREAGNAKVHRELLGKGIYYRLYAVDDTDYFVFPENAEPDAPTYVVWARGTEVGEAAGLPLVSADEALDYAYLEKTLGKKLVRVYKSGKLFMRLRFLQAFLREGVDQTAAVSLSRASDPATAKASYDQFRAEELSVPVSYHLATASNPTEAKARFDEFVASGLDVTPAYQLATAKDPVKAKEAYDRFIVAKIPPVAAYYLALMRDPDAARNRYDAYIADKLGVVAAYQLASSRNAETAKAFYDDFVEDDLPPVAAYQLAITSDPAASKLAYDGFVASGLSPVAAYRLSIARDPEASKRIYDQLIADKLEPIAAYQLASASNPVAAKAAYDGFIEEKLSPVVAYQLATTKDPAKAKAAYDTFVADGLERTPAYVLAISRNPTAARRVYNALIAVKLSVTAAYNLASTSNATAASRAYFKFLRGGLTPVAAYRLAATGNPTSAKAAYDRFVKAKIEPKVAYQLAGAADPDAAKQAYDDFIAEDLEIAAASRLATAKDPKTAKLYYDDFVQDGLTTVAAYVLAVSGNPPAAKLAYDAFIADELSVPAAYFLASAVNPAVARALYDKYIADGVPPSRAYIRAAHEYRHFGHVDLETELEADTEVSEDVSAEQPTQVNGVANDGRLNQPNRTRFDVAIMNPELNLPALAGLDNDRLGGFAPTISLPGVSRTSALAIGLEEGAPPFGRWISPEGADRTEIYDLISKHKARGYPRVKKKAPRDHGNGKAIRALQKAGYYVRIYAVDDTDYFVFPESGEPDAPAYIVWAQGEQVGEAEALPIMSDAERVDYGYLEARMGKRLVQVYKVSNVYSRLLQTESFLREGVAVIAAYALVTTTDPAKAKSAYDVFVQDGVPPTTAYKLATTKDPLTTKAVYDSFLEDELPRAAATQLAMKDDPVAAREAYDAFVASGIRSVAAYRIAAKEDPFAAKAIYDQLIDDEVPPVAALVIAVSARSESMKQFYDDFVLDGLSTTAAYQLAGTSDPVAAKAAYDSFIAAKLSPVAAYTLARKHDPAAVKSAYDALIAAELDPVTAYRLARASDPTAAKAAYDRFIAAKLSPVVAYTLASTSDPAAAKVAYDAFIADNVPAVAAYHLASRSDPVAAKRTYDALLAEDVPMVAAYYLASSRDPAIAKAAYDEFVTADVPAVAAYHLASTRDPTAAKEVYDSHRAKGDTVRASYGAALSQYSDPDSLELLESDIDVSAQSEQGVSDVDNDIGGAARPIVQYQPPRDVQNRFSTSRLRGRRRASPATEFSFAPSIPLADSSQTPALAIGLEESVQLEDVVIPLTGMTFQGWIHYGEAGAQVAPEALLRVLDSDDAVQQLVLPVARDLESDVTIFRPAGISLRSDVIGAVGGRVVDLPADPLAAAAILEVQARPTDIVLLQGVTPSQIGQWVPESVSTPVLLFQNRADLTGLAPDHLAALIGAAQSQGYLFIGRLQTVTSSEWEGTFLVIQESA